MLKEKMDDERNQYARCRPHNNLKKRVPEEFFQPFLARHFQQRLEVIMKVIDGFGLFTALAPDTACVMHDHYGKHNGNGKLDGCKPETEPGGHRERTGNRRMRTRHPAIP